MDFDWDGLYAWLIDATGWTWDYIHAHVSLDQVGVLTRYRAQHPTVSTQLRRIAAYLGVPEPESVQTSAPAKSLDDVKRAVAQMGIPIMDGLPDDPDLQFLD